MTRTLTILALLLATPAHAYNLTGRAYVVDGDGLRIGRQAIRLCGVDSPEMNTRAGKAAKKAMERLVAGRTVTCRPVGQSTPCDGRSRATSHNRIVAQCFIGNTDIAGEMVRQGHAKDWPRFSGGHYGDGR